MEASDDVVPFRINPLTGQVVTTGRLDRETVGAYGLRVTAKDGGAPALTSTATVVVTVGDVNDVTPAFYPRHYYVDDTSG